MVKENTRLKTRSSNILYVKPYEFKYKNYNYLIIKYIYI
jgi:hypothetical protein